jgi:hypothetical protein
MVGIQNLLTLLYWALYIWVKACVFHYILLGLCFFLCYVEISKRIRYSVCCT